MTPPVLAVIFVEVATVGSALDAHPFVVNVASVDVALFPVASRDTAATWYVVHAKRLVSATEWLVTRGDVFVSEVTDPYELVSP